MFSLPEVKDNHLAFLSQNLCQDPVEKFFGCQRQRGDTSDNPNVQEFYNNTGALWVVNSFAVVQLQETAVVPVNPLTC